MAEPQKLFRPINQSLGQQPSLGPIPANLLAPTGAILIVAYVLVQVILNLGFAPFLLLSAWGISTWWMVVGEKVWKFTNKFVSVPDWTRGHVPYQPQLYE
ncbi:MAG: hypothetical protein AAFV72_14865 [Cyanobacteria bacterium J06635_1]